MFDPIEAIKALVRCPSVSTDPAFADGMTAAREELNKLFEEMGLEVEVVETPRHPLILARRTGPDDWPHVVIYGHYDVQPPDPLNLWDSPAFEPTMRGTRLYGRGVADNKGPMMVHIAAAAQLLNEDPDLPLRLTFLIEGEEEIGSPSLPAILESHGELLKGDFIMLSDTLNPTSDQVAITSGLRGIMTLEAEIVGPKSDLHSGMNGGAIYNPIQALTEICASLHHPDGRVNVPGFYDNVILPEEWEKEELKKLPVNDASLQEWAGVPGLHTPGNCTAMEAIRFEPTLEFNGIGGGYQGKGDKTIIPSRAFVKISCRLVANQKPEEVRDQVISALRERCPAQVKMTIQEGHHGPAYLVAPPGKSNTPATQNPHLARAFKACHSSVTEVFGKPPLYLREGGSIPIIGIMNETLGTDCLMLGMGTAENNLHAPNESFDLALLEKGIAVSKAVLLEVAKGA